MRKPNFKKCDVCSWAKHEGGGGLKYQSRFFTVDHERHKLRYFKSNPSLASKKRRLFRVKQRGEIDLRSVQAVRAARAAKAPEFALELVTEEKNYLVVPEGKQAYLRWAYKLAEAVKVAQDAPEEDEVDEEDDIDL